MAPNETYRDEDRTLLFYTKQVLSKIFLEDWTTKLVALAITIALWVGVTGLSTPTTRRMSDIPLTLSYSDKTEITNAPVQSVNLVISGDKRKVNQITDSNLVVSIDLTDVQPGDRVIQLTPENVSIDLPLGVKLQEIQPSRIQVRLEAVEQKEVGVTVDTQGELPDGLEVYSETVNPPRVTVRGPASYVRTISTVPTEKIDLADKRADFTARQIPLNLANPKASVVETVVDVMFRIGERRIERSITVPVEGGSKKAQIVMFGPASAFESIEPADIKVVSVEGSEKPNVQLPPSIEGRVEIRKVKLN